MEGWTGLWRDGQGFGVDVVAIFFFSLRPRGDSAGNFLLVP